jgi:hypothetical protein
MALTSVRWLGAVTLLAVSVLLQAWAWLIIALTHGVAAGFAERCRKDLNDPE